MKTRLANLLHNLISKEAHTMHETWVGILAIVICEMWLRPEETIHHLENTFSFWFK